MDSAHRDEQRIKRTSSLSLVHEVRSGEGRLGGDWAIRRCEKYDVAVEALHNDRSERRQERGRETERNTGVGVGHA